MNTNTTAKLYTLLAELLSYPQPDLAQRVQDSIALLADSLPAAAKELEGFRQALLQLTPGQLEELYSSTFDLSPVCSPYVGYYLFGDNHKRSEFMVKLKTDYNIYDFDSQGEMPDHLAVLLRFMSVLEDEYSAHSLIRECLVPAVAKMESASSGKEGNVYHGVIRAVALVLEQELKKDLPGGPQNAE